MNRRLDGQRGERGVRVVDRVTESSRDGEADAVAPGLGHG
jgi:hypothetical protein